MRFIDLFAGIGGFHYGITRTNTSRQVKENNSAVTNAENQYQGNKEPFTCVYSNEWDKYANSVYRKHFKNCDNRDITTVDASEIPEHDLLVGGFPCQSFSLAGKRGGFADARGTLFFEIARILEERKPRLCLLENVKGLLSHENGKTFGIIINTLDELGYDIQWQVLDSKNFGVPQHRERVFIVGHLRGTPRPEVFPFTEYGPEVEKSDHFLVDANRKEKRVFSEYSFTLKSRMGLGGNNMPIVDAIRRMTPLECERLQGFPDEWTKFGADGEIISDSQRYKMTGNAVTTNVITAIAERLL